MAEELYQEFFLSLCEITDNRLVEAEEGKYLDVLCVGIINNIWGKRDRVKTYANGSTHPLYELNKAHQTFDLRDDESRHIYDTEFGRSQTLQRSLADTSEPYDLASDIRSQRAVDHMRELVEKAKESENESERFKARVFHYSRFMYKNTMQFSKASGIPYHVCVEAYNSFKERIKKAHLCNIY